MLLSVTLEFVEHGGSVAVGLAAIGDEGVGKDAAWRTSVAEGDEFGGVFLVLVARVGTCHGLFQLFLETLDELGLLIVVEMFGVFSEGCEEAVIGLHQMGEEAIVPVLKGVYLGKGVIGSKTEVALLEESGQEGWPLFGGDETLEVAVVFHRVVVLDEEELERTDDGVIVAQFLVDGEFGALPGKGDATVVFGGGDAFIEGSEGLFQVVLVNKELDVTGAEVMQFLVLEVEVDGLLLTVEEKEVIPEFDGLTLFVVIAGGVMKGFFSEGDALVIGKEEVTGVFDEFDDAETIVIEDFGMR